MKYLLLLVLSQFAQADDWFCKTQVAKKAGNVWSICGVGLGSHDLPQEGRWEAYHDAQRNFESICDKSSDCKDRKIKVEPKRLECELMDRVVDKCYQLLEITVLEE